MTYSNPSLQGVRGIRSMMKGLVYLNIYRRKYISRDLNIAINSTWLYHWWYDFDTFHTLPMDATLFSIVIHSLHIKLTTLSYAYIATIFVQKELTTTKFLRRTDFHHSTCYVKIKGLLSELYMISRCGKFHQTRGEQPSRQQDLCWHDSFTPPCSKFQDRAHKGNGGGPIRLPPAH